MSAGTFTRVSGAAAQQRSNARLPSRTEFAATHLHLAKMHPEAWEYVTTNALRAARLAMRHQLWLTMTQYTPFLVAMIVDCMVSCSTSAAMQWQLNHEDQHARHDGSKQQTAGELCFEVQYRTVICLAVCIHGTNHLR